MKGETAEETDIPKSVSGTVQNMYWTVTQVERYRYLHIAGYTFTVLPIMHLCHGAPYAYPWFFIPL